jgi:hypothetical protein
MLVKATDEEKNEIIGKIVGLINNVMGYIELFEPNRPASIAITKLEEAVMWSQVMVANVNLKEDVKQKIQDLKDELKEADADVE